LQDFWGCKLNETIYKRFDKSNYVVYIDNTNYLPKYGVFFKFYLYGLLKRIDDVNRCATTKRLLAKKYY